MERDLASTLIVSSTELLLLINDLYIMHDDQKKWKKRKAPALVLHLYRMTLISTCFQASFHSPQDVKTQNPTSRLRVLQQHAAASQFPLISLPFLCLHEFNIYEFLYEPSPSVQINLIITSIVSPQIEPRLNSHWFYKSLWNIPTTCAHY